MRPVFLSRGVTDTGSARIVGEDHLKMNLVQGPNRGRRPLDAIAFRLGQHLELVKSGQPFSVLYSVEENEWQGRRSLQLNIKDIKPGVSGILENEANPSELAQAS
jgi:single-stranded-DNA-specific exonuclease